jgi:ribosomal-protein-alanine N-acetyltransferase
MIVAMELVTSRLLLRELSESDHPAVHGYAGDPVVARFMDWGPNTPADTAACLASVLEEADAVPRLGFTLAIVVRATSELVGAVHPAVTKAEHRRGEMGYVLAAAQWGNGYATEAGAAILRFGFDQVGLHQIVATCDPENAASAHVLERIGMRREGYLHEHLLIRGQWRDRLTFGAVA